MENSHTSSCQDPSIPPEIKRKWNIYIYKWQLFTATFIYFKIYSLGWLMLWTIPEMPACAWPCEIASSTRLHGCSDTARRARYLCICAGKLFWKQQRWSEDLTLHFLSFLSVAPSPIWLHKCLDEVKEKKQMCPHKMDVYHHKINFK